MCAVKVRNAKLRNYLKEALFLSWLFMQEIVGSSSRVYFFLPNQPIARDITQWLI